ncbi:hypothetical protein CASFOL_009260 [Castilleja foliolosa]|uniref:Pentatricopeptide repeat-containing protein n=1 Tax=Castilleja foliolosa TaxID=1961234 RepID=A0ABD3DWT0_9LAMI
MANLLNYTLYGRLIHRCTVHRLLRQAKQLHAHLILTSTPADNFLSSKLIAFYSKTHQLSYAHHVFDQIPRKNTFAFNALLIAYSVHHRHTDTLRLFNSYLSQRDDCWDLMEVKPDCFTLSCALKAMTEVASHGPLLAQMMHCYVIKYGLDWDVFVNNGLVSFYSRCEDLVSARKVFDKMPERDLVSWNSMMSGYSQGGSYDECKDLYRTMLGSKKDPTPDGVTAVSVLHACAQSNDLVFGMDVHQYVINNRIKLDLSLCNSIISVYAKCGSLDYGKELFQEMNEKDEITYNTIISGYMVHGFVDEAMKIFKEMRNPGLSTWNAVISGRVQNNQYDDVLELARRMQVLGFKPNNVTLSSILPAVPHVSHLRVGKEIHGYAIKMNYDRNIYVVTAMIDTYAKLGFLNGAHSVFNLAKDNRSVIVWTAIISSYAFHGDADMALSLFNEMLSSKTKPDSVTFTAVLSACAHAGLVDEALKIFHNTLPKYGVEPLVNQYACLVACLCRAGRVYEAAGFVKKMSIEPNGQVWGALLSGASEIGDVELAKFVCGYLFELEPENPSNYVVMANMYSKAGRWEEAERVREQMANVGFKKVAGSSRI